MEPGANPGRSRRCNRGQSRRCHCLGRSGGKGRVRLIRKPEDEQIDPQGRFMVTTAPGPRAPGAFFIKTGYGLWAMGYR
jgi:hypothetical protein